jgi:hypothetical protein
MAGLGDYDRLVGMVSQAVIGRAIKVTVTACDCTRFDEQVSVVRCGMERVCVAGQKKAGCLKLNPKPSQDDQGCLSLGSWVLDDGDGILSGTGSRVWLAVAGD